MRVVGLATPAVLVLADEQQQPGVGQALHQAVEQGLRLGVEPVQVSKTSSRGCSWLSRKIKRFTASRVCRRCGGSRALPGGFHRQVQQRQEHRQRRPQGVVQGQQLAREFLLDAPAFIAFLDLQYAFRRSRTGR